MSSRYQIGPHLVRYGTPADQGYLLDPFLETYNSLLINATMVAHIPSALASFVTRRAKGKPYIIDPQTHAFQHDTSHLESISESSQGEIKRSFRSLLDAYGEPAKSTVGQRRQPLLPDDFKADKTRLGFCRRVLQFQECAIRREIEESDAAKYYQFLKRAGKATSETRQLTLIPPYFYLTSSTLSQWLPLNLEFLDIGAALAKEKGAKCAAQIVISRDLLTSSGRRRDLVDRYRQRAKPDYFLVWMDRFSETEAAEDDLKAFVEFLRGLADVAPVVNLYGGFFSVALMKLQLIKNLVGVTHGLEYGEDRGVLPVGGGVPVAKFYLPALHSRLVFRDAIRSVRALGGMQNPEDFHREVCDCQECKSVIRRNPNEEFQEYGRTRPVAFIRRNQPVGLDYPLPETKQHCVRHYMWCKNREYSRSQTLSLLVEELDGAKSVLGRVLGLEKVAHCENWKRVLISFGKG